MKVKTGIAVGMLAMLLGSADCATVGPNPCIGTAAQRATMPCTCPGSTDPACYPFPQDAKKPKKTTTEGDRK